MKTPVKKFRRGQLRGLRTDRIIMRIVEAACRLRDFDWETDDPGPILDEIDAAVDTWRQRLLNEAASSSVSSAALRSQAP